MPLHCSLKEAIVANQLCPDGTSIFRARNLFTGRDSFYLSENLLLYADEGNVTFYYGETRFIVKKQQFVFLRKNSLLEYESENPDSVFFIVVLKNETVSAFIRKTPVNSTILQPSRKITAGQPGTYLRMYFESLRYYLSEDAAIPVDLVQIKLKELLFCISRNAPAIVEQLLDTREQYKPDMTRIIEDNLMDSLPVDKLARLTGRSTSSFRRDFLSVYNMPPSRWIRLKKLEKAKQLLAATNMTVTSICYTLGFENIAHFSRLFKSHFGYPPSGTRMKTTPVHSEKMCLEFL